MINKNNVPYYITGTLATFTLLASGIFAAVPYIGFLAPVAALSVGLPFIIGCAIFSVVTIALSYKAISENKTNSELKNEIEVQKQENSELEKKVKAQEKENSELKSKMEAQEEENSELKNEMKDQEQTISGQKTQLAEKNKKIEEDKLKVAIADGTVQLAKGTVNSAVWFAKEAVNGVLYSGKYAYDNYVPSTESTKGTLSGIGGSLKNTYDASIASVRGALNSVGSGLKNTCDTSIESAKGTISSVGNKLKNVYDTMPSTKIGFSWVSEKFSSCRNSFENLMFGNKADQTSDASQLSSESQNNGIVIPEGARLELSPRLSDFLLREKRKMVRQLLREQTDEEKNVATQENLKTETPSQENQLNINNAPRQLDHPSIDAENKPSMQELTRLNYDVSSQLAGDEEDIFYDAESGDEKDTEISSLKEQLDENNKTKIQSRISVVYELVKGKFTSFWSGVQNSCVLGTNLLHAQHKNTLANVPQEEVINKEAQKPEEQADQKPNLQRDNSINNTEEGGKNKRSGAARRKRKQAQVEQPIVYAVSTSNKYDLLSSKCFLG